MVISKTGTTSENLDLVAVTVAEEATSDSEDDFDDCDDVNLVSESKKKSGGHDQLYAEAFNVATTSVARLVSLKRLQCIDKVCVYCILLTNECRCGNLSKLIIDFENSSCVIKKRRGLNSKP